MPRTEVQAFFAQQMPAHLSMRERWQRLTRWLDTLPNEKIPHIIDQVEIQLDLPEELRVSPARWIRESLSQKPSPKLRLVRNLVLGKPALGDLRFIKLLGHPQLFELSRIKLFAHHLGDDSAIMIANRTSSARIRTINWSANRIGSSGLEALANSPYLLNLCELYLGRNQIGDQGAHALAQSKELPMLSLIDLRGNPLSTKAWQRLRSAPTLKNCEIRN